VQLSIRSCLCLDCSNPCRIQLGLLLHLYSSLLLLLDEPALVYLAHHLHLLLILLTLHLDLHLLSRLLSKLLLYSRLQHIQLHLLALHFSFASLDLSSDTVDLNFHCFAFLILDPNLGLQLAFNSVKLAHLALVCSNLAFLVSDLLFEIIDFLPQLLVAVGKAFNVSVPDLTLVTNFLVTCHHCLEHIVLFIVKLRLQILLLLPIALIISLILCPLLDQLVQLGLQLH